MTSADSWVRGSYLNAELQMAKSRPGEAVVIGSREGGAFKVKSSAGATASNIRNGKIPGPFVGIREFKTVVCPGDELDTWFVQVVWVGNAR
jgi:hypothetical protein